MAQLPPNGRWKKGAELVNGEVILGASSVQGISMTKWDRRVVGQGDGYSIEQLTRRDLNYYVEVEPDNEFGPVSP